MCYHYSLTKKQEEIMRMIQAEWEMPFEPIYHSGGFSFPLMPVQTMEMPGQVQAYSWGLVPHWVKTMDDAQKLRAQTLNAKGETLFEKPAFRNSVSNHRCIAMADGFFEWMDFKGKKYPHYIHLDGGELFGFAGIYSHWTDKETGELLRTFAIITTRATPFMARIHNLKKRQPVILTQDLWSRWLNPSLTKEEIGMMLMPCDETRLRARAISKQITSRGVDTNVPEVIQPQTYPELQSEEQRSLFD